MNKFLTRLLSIVAEFGNVYEEVNKKTKNKDFSTNGASEIMCISKLNINKKSAFVICLIFQDINLPTYAICCSILPNLLNANQKSKTTHYKYAA